jgi:hypothetical protein
VQEPRPQRIVFGDPVLGGLDQARRVERSLMNSTAILVQPEVARKYTREALRKLPWDALRQFPHDWLRACLITSQLPEPRRRAVEFMLTP